MIRAFLREARRSTLHMEHRKRRTEGGATIKVTKIMPITLMNDAQYRLPGLVPNAELETEYVNLRRHFRKKGIGHTRRSDNYVIFPLPRILFLKFWPAAIKNSHSELKIKNFRFYSYKNFIPSVIISNKIFSSFFNNFQRLLIYQLTCIIFKCMSILFKMHFYS